MGTLLLSTVGCDSQPPRQQSTEELTRLYNKFLNFNFYIQKTNIEGYANDNSIADLYSWGYFTYNLDRNSMEKLLRHQTFAQESHWNKKFTKEPVAGAIEHLNVNYYIHTMHKNIVVTDKNREAYTATFFPYVHTILYDTTTGNVQHFVGGMRD